MTIRYGANGQPIPEKKKEETLQEILEVNPNTVEEEVEEVQEDLSSDWEAEEEELEEEDEENEDL
jgi:predicted Co/Zn/Cd cation transporter (cation efflux family)